MLSYARVGRGLYICGFVDPILDDMVSTGVTNISIDAPTDLARARHEEMNLGVRVKGAQDTSSNGPDVVLRRCESDHGPSLQNRYW